MKYLFIILFAILAGHFFNIYGYLFLAVLILSISLLYLLLKFKTPTIYSIFFVFLIWCPTWVNSYSLFGIRFGILTINVPLIFLGVFLIKSIADIYTGKTRLKMNFIDWVILFFLGWTFFSAITKSLSPRSKSSFYLLGFPIIYYFTLKFTPVKKSDLLKWMKILIYFSTFTVIYLIFELITKINVFLPPENIYRRFIYTYTIETKGVYQPSGPFIDPNTAGLFIPLIIAMCLYFYNISQTNKKQSKWMALISILVIGVLVTLSRTAYFCTLIVFLINFLFVTKKRLKIAFIAVGSSISLAFFLQFCKLPSILTNRLYDFQTIRARISYWNDFTLLIRKHWLCGIGFDNFRYRFLMVEGPSHNIFTTIFSELGIIGLIPFLIIIFYIFSLYKNLVNHRPIDKLLLITLLTIFIGYWVGGLTMTSYLYIQLNSIFWIFLSIYFNHLHILLSIPNENPSCQ